MTSGRFSGPPESIFEWTSEWASKTNLKFWATDETHSTNSVAKDDLSETRPSLSQPSLYITKLQTAGRGRRDHVWNTPQKGALLSTWSFSIQKVPQPIFSALVGLALFEAAMQTWPEIDFNLKAPNDLFIGDKKTAGILIETVDQGIEKRTAVGVGVNVFSEPQDIATATCISNHIKNVDRDAWSKFLSTWFENLKLAILAGQNQRLESATTERLKNALNRHPLLKEPILRVDELGQLHSASRTIYWHEL